MTAQFADYALFVEHDDSIAVMGLKNSMIRHPYYVVMLIGDVSSLSFFLRVPRLREDKYLGKRERKAGLEWLWGDWGVVTGCWMLSVDSTDENNRKDGSSPPTCRSCS